MTLSVYVGQLCEAPTPPSLRHRLRIVRAVRIVRADNIKTRNKKTEQNRKHLVSLCTHLFTSITSGSCVKLWHTAQYSSRKNYLPPSFAKKQIQQKAILYHSVPLLGKQCLPRLSCTTLTKPRHCKNIRSPPQSELP
jgi:hypothetical protein